MLHCSKSHGCDGQADGYVTTASVCMADFEGLKVAAEKARIAWNAIDPDLKTALVAGCTAGVSPSRMADSSQNYRMHLGVTGQFHQTQPSA